MSEPPNDVPQSFRTLLICHDDAPLDFDGLARWLGSFSELVGIVVIREAKTQLRRRLRRELKRSGIVRLLDVMAFRAWYRVALAASDRRWTQQQLDQLRARFAAVDVPVLEVTTPNSAQAREFIAELSPDIMLARCKFLLKREIFDIPRSGTFVLHPGICPEYRNAHGCFWALAQRDLDRVGVTLLRIDEGVDTGPVYGYYTYDYDEAAESHYRIQWRCVLENLGAIGHRFGDIVSGNAVPLDTSGRHSAVYGQPWLTRYLSWKRHARRRSA